MKLQFDYEGRKYEVDSVEETNEGFHVSNLMHGIVLPDGRWLMQNEILYSDPPQFTTFEDITNEYDSKTPEGIELKLRACIAKVVENT